MIDMANLANISIKTIEDHKENTMNLDSSSIPSNRLEIASYGLSKPKMVKENQTKVKTMVSKQKKPVAQENEQKNLPQAQALAISAKVEVEKEIEKCPECLGQMKDGTCLDCGWTPEFARVWGKLVALEVENKSEVKSMDTKTKVVKKRVVKKKAVHRKQRKGKSLLTAFRINHMTRRLVLDLRRGELKGKYA